MAQTVINGNEMERQIMNIRKARMLTDLYNKINERLKFWLFHNRKVNISDLKVVIACYPEWVTDNVMVTNIGRASASVEGKVLKKQVGYREYEAFMTECRLRNEDIARIMKCEIPTLVQNLFDDAESHNGRLKYCFTISFN